MPLPRRQLVSDLLHDIAQLVQEADSYIVESKLSPLPVSGLGKKRPRPSLSPTPFAKSGSKKKKKCVALFVSTQDKLKPQRRSGGLEPHKTDRISNRLRRVAEKISKPAASVLRSRRERKARSRYQAIKLVQGVPKKSLGTRLRTR